MKVTKSLLLGAAASLVVMSGAQAADLPVKAKAVEYVKVCPAYGAGFYYIPGTDICLRVGGFVRFDVGHNTDGSFPIIGQGAPGPGLVDERGREMTTQFHTRAAILLDARQQTAYGTLRAYLDGGWQMRGRPIGTGAYTGHGPGAVWEASRAFIQFAGWTFGRATSFFDFYGSTGPHANIVNWGGTSSTGAIGWNVLAYTAQFGGGMSGSISIEELRTKGIATGGATAGANVRAGQQLPALTGNLRWDGSAGSVQIMGAVQELNVTTLTVDRELGWAVGAGFTWNNMAAPGSQFGIQASYCDGANSYCAGSYTNHSFGTTSGALVDAVVVGTSITSVKAWGVNAGYQHRFSPTYAFTIHGSYTNVDNPSSVAASDFNFWQAGARALWTPVPGLDFGLDVMYNSFGSDGVFTAGRTSRDTFWSAMFRVLRPF